MTKIETGNIYAIKDKDEITFLYCYAYNSISEHWFFYEMKLMPIDTDKEFFTSRGNLFELVKTKNEIGTNKGTCEYCHSVNVQALQFSESEGGMVTVCHNCKKWFIDYES